MADEDDRLEDQLFKEVDEELRAERYMKMWRAYGKYVVALVVVVMIGTSGFVWWRNNQITVRGEQGEAYAAAVALARAGKTDSALAALSALAARSGTGYRALARLQEAALRAKKGQTKAAVALYDAIAADRASDRIIRDLATVLGVLTDLDTGAPAALTAKLAPLAKGGGPWRHLALELTAVLAQRAGDNTKAREIYIKLVDDATAPAALRARARVMLEVLGKS